MCHHNKTPSQTHGYLLMLFGVWGASLPTFSLVFSHWIEQITSQMKCSFGGWKMLKSFHTITITERRTVLIAWLHLSAVSTQVSSVKRTKSTENHSKYGQLLFTWSYSTFQFSKKTLCQVSKFCFQFTELLLGIYLTSSRKTQDRPAPHIFSLQPTPTPTPQSQVIRPSQSAKSNAKLL